MCDVKKYEQIYNEIKKLQPEDTMQLVLEADTEEQREFYEMVGDYLLSTALKHAATAGNLEVVDIVARLGQTLSDGELQQLSNVKSDEISEEQYFDVIRSKTASLFASCAEVGALLSGATKTQIARLRDFGTYVGLCFQIRDDVFDYYDVEVGKPTGNDIREGKVTLPLLFALRQGGREADELRRIILAKDFTDEHIERLIAFAKAQGGIEYAEKKMEEFQQKAVGLLAQLPDTLAKQSLKILSEYIISRKS